MIKHQRTATPIAAILGVSLALSALTACSVTSDPQSWVAAIEDAKKQATELAANRDQIIADASAFGASAQKSITDAVASAQTSADEARAALESLNNKRSSAEADVEAARQQLTDAKAKLDELSATLSGDELAAIETERDKIVGALDSLISQLEVDQ